MICEVYILHTEYYNMICEVYIFFADMHGHNEH